MLPIPYAAFTYEVNSFSELIKVSNKTGKVLPLGKIPKKVQDAHDDWLNLNFNPSDYEKVEASIGYLDYTDKQQDDMKTAWNNLLVLIKDKGYNVKDEGHDKELFSFWNSLKFTDHIVKFNKSKSLCGAFDQWINNVKFIKEQKEIIINNQEMDKFITQDFDTDIEADQVDGIKLQSDFIVNSLIKILKTLKTDANYPYYPEYLKDTESLDTFSFLENQRWCELIEVFDFSLTFCELINLLKDNGILGTKSKNNLGKWTTKDFPEFNDDQSEKIKNKSISQRLESFTKQIITRIKKFIAKIREALSTRNLSHKVDAHKSNEPVDNNLCQP